MSEALFAILLGGFVLTFTSNAFAGEGHDAGRQWAVSHGIDDPDDCRSAYPGKWTDDNINNSPSFTEGCLEIVRDSGVTDDDDELVNEDDALDDEDQDDDDGE